MSDPTATPPVEWLVSHYDECGHVFRSEQIADSTRQFVQALCEHSVPVTKLGHTPPEVLCPACVQALGELMPEVPLWRMGD